MQLRTCMRAFPIRQGRATTMASDPQRGQLVPIVASLAGIHSRVALSAVSIDTKSAQSSNWRPHLVHSRLIRIRLLLDGLAILRLSPSCTMRRVYGMCGLYTRAAEKVSCSETHSASAPIGSGSHLPGSTPLNKGLSEALRALLTDAVRVGRVCCVN